MILSQCGFLLIFSRFFGKSRLLNLHCRFYFMTVAFHHLQVVLFDLFKGDNSRLCCFLDKIDDIVLQFKLGIGFDDFLRLCFLRMFDN